MQIQRRGGEERGSDTHLKYHKYIEFSSNTGPDPLKNRSYQASIQCWAIISTPTKRHLKAFCWRADDGPFIVELGSSLPSLTKKNKNKQKKKNKKQNKKINVVKVGHPLKNFLDLRMANVMFLTIHFL